ncbi:MAG: MBL fold metallo-hydrolase [Bacteroidia bacterium]|nr:MBL fold metallo-hydrolase [Bacteroidia bacterium]
MIRPVQQGEGLLRDIAATAGKQEGFRVWWLGQSGFLIQWAGKHLLLDPYLSDSLSLKYAQTDKPHTRISERVIAPALLDMITVVTSSHNHTDHLDAETLGPVLAASPAAHFLIPEANRAFVCQRLGCDPAFPVGINDGETLHLAGFEFTGIPAAHNTIDRDDQGRCCYLGYIVRFGPYAIYHSGDTLWYPGLETWVRPHEVDIAFLPINGNLPERRVAGNMDAREAAAFGQACAARCVIPHHYDMFAFNTADPQDFVAAAQALKVPHLVLRLGEQTEISAKG